jgi:hypothetical protein
LALAAATLALVCSLAMEGAALGEVTADDEALDGALVEHPTSRSAHTGLARGFIGSRSW